MQSCWQERQLRALMTARPSLQLALFPTKNIAGHLYFIHAKALLPILPFLPFLSCLHNEQAYKAYAKVTSTRKNLSMQPILEDLDLQKPKVVSYPVCIYIRGVETGLKAILERAALCLSLEELSVQKSKSQFQRGPAVFATGLCRPIHRLPRARVLIRSLVLNLVIRQAHHWGLPLAL